MSQSPTSFQQEKKLTVAPQVVSDPTILESVAGFINEVVPTYNVSCETKDQIQWAHFEQPNLDDITFFPNLESDNVIIPPLILVLGYTTGVQVWALPANGEAVELFSWRHGSVRVLRILPNPHRIDNVDSAIDSFSSKRPLIALCDTSAASTQYCNLKIISVKTGEQIKVIKFKNSILDVCANRKFVVVTFAEKIAIFDAFTLEDRITITTCYLSPGLQPNPIALGTRWLAYAENKLNPSQRSSGGNEGEGIQSYTATVLHAAKSLGRGLRELGETVASSLTGNPNFKPGVPSNPQVGGQTDIQQKGVVTIIDIESPSIKPAEKLIQNEAIIAHFTAHPEAIVCLQFDPSGLLLLTADKRGHNFHLFRIHPHPIGPTYAAVHHLYVLHRGDTTARVQDMCFSPDSRWVTVSSLRGTTHVFPITPYGGNVGVRTHTTPHVVNKMSRFHRSAGLTLDGRSNSPLTVCEAPVISQLPFSNPRYPPFPQPTMIQPYAQIRQPVYVQNVGTPQRQHTGSRQRLSSSNSEENIALRVVACFAQPRGYIDGVTPPHETHLKRQPNPVESLFIMSCHGVLVQYDLDPHQTAVVPKERVCDETPIELSVYAKAQWLLQRQPSSVDVPLPLCGENLNFIAQSVPETAVKNSGEESDEYWLSQVEIVTHAGPHRRLWMGPQFTFKTYTTISGSSFNEADAKTIDLDRTKPVNMPMTKANPVFIEATSANSCEQSLLDTYQKTCKEAGGAGELQLKEDLADAMMESPILRETGSSSTRATATSGNKPNTHPSLQPVTKVVNPLGTVVTVHSDEDVEIPEDEPFIHENCDETLFRPVITTASVILEATSKSKSNSKKKKNCEENIVTKSLQDTLGVSVNLVKNNPEKKKKNEKKNVVEDQLDFNKKKNDVKKVLEEEIDLDLKGSHDNKCSSEIDSFNINSTTFDKVSSFNVDFITPASKDEKKKKELLIDDDIFLPPIEKFEDAQDESLNFIKNNNNKENLTKTKNNTCPVFDEILDEKPFTKKQRKPKSKLGVKIGKEQQQNQEKSMESCLTKPWNLIAATTKSGSTEKEKSLIDSVEKETILIPFMEDDDVVKDEPPNVLEEFCIDKELEETKITSSVNCEIEQNLDLLKLDKSSDEEKVEGASAETTESDDSSKVPLEEAVLSAELESNSSKNTPPSKAAAKRKLKKKRK